MTANLTIEYLSPDALRPYKFNPRTHPSGQIEQLCNSIKAFGFTSPVLISEDNEIIAGHGRHMAAVKLELRQIPVIRLHGLDADQRKALMIADNKIALNAGWDIDNLSLMLEEIVLSDVGIELTGFSPVEIDATLELAKASDPSGKDDPADALPADGPPITKLGDRWLLGRHAVLCDDAQNPAAFTELMQGEQARMVMTDPPYNVRIDKNVTGLGKVRHREFAMASGEMSREEFTRFLSTTLGNAAACCIDGAIVFAFTDWRHIQEMTAAGREVFSDLKNVCVWAKTNAGMGAFYRSRHEFVFVFKVGTAPHINTFGLGGGGRSRSNVWTYAGVNSFRAGRMDDLKMHPTVKPVALVKDALLDVSLRNDIVLDPFAGSGTTLIAAHQVGRRARVIELDPVYCDLIVRRWCKLTGQPAVRAADGVRFDALEAGALNTPDSAEEAA